MKIHLPQKAPLFIIPGLIVIWTVYLSFYLGPFFLRNIDPEYVYFISGLNCSTLDFHKIGHIDHPGTPFQLLTGIFFRIVHLFTGHNDIITDAIADPELYLSLSNLMLTIITFVVVLRLGMLVFKHSSSILGALVLQASFFFTEIHMGILSRYNPDRMIVIAIIIFFILYIRYLYDQKFSVFKFSVLSGIVMGFGLVTKYNFIPLLIIPLVLIPGWKSRAYYILSSVISIFLFLLPIFSKLDTFWRSLKVWITHSGLYGKGEQEIIDTSLFFKNIALVFKDNPAFIIITALGGLCIFILAIRPKLRATNKNGFLFLIASFISIVIGLAITAKHYKNYYALPFLSLIPMILYTIILFIERAMYFRYKTYISSSLFIILLLFPIISTTKGFSGINNNLQDKRITEAFIRDQISSKDYFIITPFWLASPMPEAAMALGVSWQHRRELSYLDYERIFPNIITWEGKDKPLKYMRMRNANFEEVLLSGRGIHIYSKPGWNGPELCQYIENFAREAGIQVERDTVYSFSEIKEHIIRYRNTDGWETRLDLNCGFEKFNNDQLYSDNGLISLIGDFVVQDEISAHGNYSAVLEDDMTKSPYYTVKGTKSGDVISSSVKSNLSKTDNIENILITCEYTDIKGNLISLVSDPSPGRIHEAWYMSDFFAPIESQPADSSIRVYVEYTGNESVRLDDFTLKVYSQNQ